MYNHSNKKLVRYSLTKLAGGLFYYLRTKPFDEITITEICKQAGIARRTYYRNCEDKTDLILHSTDYLDAELLSQNDFSSEDADGQYLAFFRYWLDHREFLSLLYLNDLFGIFIEEFVNVCNEKLRLSMQDEVTADDKDHVSMWMFGNSFVIGGLCSVLLRWTAEDFETSPEVIVRSMSDLYRHISPVKDLILPGEE